MSHSLTAAHSDSDLARLYKLQVRDLEDVALFLADSKGRLITWNQGVQNTFGYREDEWLGQHVGIIFTEEDRAAGVVDAELDAAATQGRCVDVRWHLRKDGSRVYMTGTLRGLRDENGQLIGYSKLFMDDTARKQLEDALTQSNQDLQQFAFVASHDLHEPLHTISNFAELLRCRWREQPESETEQMLAYMIEATQRMSRLTTDLLTYSQLNQEESPVTSVHLDEDLETAVSLLHTTIEQTGAVITHDALPNIELARSQMVRIFQNLLSNALKFRKMIERPRIHISAEKRESEWIIRVADNGIGFGPEDATTIFAPFKRLHTSDAYPGSGIGLAACKRMVERYGGRIGAEGKPHEGATFWFTVPVGDTYDKPFGIHASPSVPE